MAKSACPTCLGLGEIRTDAEEPPQCPTCDGTGKVEDNG